MPLSQGDFDKISAIWMLASYDMDAIITYKGIEYRLGIDEKDAQGLVKSRPELFSPVIAKDWLKHWKEWVTKGLHYPGWVLKEKETGKDPKALINSLQIGDVFRSQLRTRGNPNWVWKDDETPPPGSGPSTHEEVKLGLEHLDRLRKAGAEERAQLWTRVSILTAFLLPMSALALTSYLTYKNNVRTSEIAAYDANIKRWELAERIRKDAYESSLEAMQAAFDAARRGDQGEVQKQIARIRMNLLRLEPLIGDSRNDLWRDYEELSKLLGASPFPEDAGVQFQNLSKRLHDRLYNILFGASAAEFNALSEGPR
jgi:hypothetical protein